MKLEIYIDKITHRHKKCIKPLNNETLFMHCAREQPWVGYHDYWPEVLELLKAHGVMKFSYVDKTGERR